MDIKNQTIEPRELIGIFDLVSAANGSRFGQKQKQTIVSAPRGV